MPTAQRVPSRVLAVACVLVSAALLPFSPSEMPAEAAALSSLPAPSEVTIESGNQAVTVYFQPINGDAAVVTGYEARCVEARIVDAAALTHGVGTDAFYSALDQAPASTGIGVSPPIVVTGLTTSSLYKCDVAATDAEGTGARSPMVLAAAGVVDPGDFADPIDVPSFPSGCDESKVVTNRDGAVIVARQCSTGAGSDVTYEIRATFRPAGGEFGPVVSLGQNVAVCPYTDWLLVITCAGRKTFRAVFYADGSAGVLFSRRTPGSSSPYTGQIALDEARFDADGTLVPARELVDSDAFGAEGSFSVARSMAGDVVIAWEARTDKAQIAFISRAADADDYSAVRLGPENVLYPNGWSAGTRDTLGFDANGRAVSIGVYRPSPAEAGNGYALAYLDLKSGATSASQPIDLSENWLRQVSFSHNEVALVLATLSLSSVKTKVLVLSLRDGSELVRSDLHEGPIYDAITLASNARGDTVVAHVEKLGSDRYQLWALVRPAEGDVFSDVLIQSGVANYLVMDAISLSLDANGYGIFAWDTVAQDGSGTGTSHIAVLEPPAATQSASSASVVTSSGVRAASRPTVHTDIALPATFKRSGGRVSFSIEQGIVNALGTTTSNRNAVTWGTGFAVRYKRPPTEPLMPTVSTWNRSARVSWTAPSPQSGVSVRGYAVQSSTDGRTWTTSAANVSATQHVVAGLKNGRRYFFRVLASNADGASKWVTASGTPASVASAPAAPTVGAKGTTATLRWKRPEFAPNLVTAYRIQMSANGRRWTTVVAKAPRRTLRVTVNGLKKRTSYRFRVVPLNGKIAGNPSEPSTPVKIK